MRALFFLFLLSFTLVSGQNTLQLEEHQNSPNANLDDVAWIEGHWRGTAFGGITEEIWGPPLGGSMMFVFKHVADGEITFYEVGHIRQINKSLIFELKHFDSKLHGWEVKDEVQQFRYIKTEANRVYFDGFTFENVSSDEMNIYGLIGDENDTTKEVTFNYKRQ